MVGLGEAVMGVCQCMFDIQRHIWPNLSYASIEVMQVHPFINNMAIPIIIQMLLSRCWHVLFWSLCWITLHLPIIINPSPSPPSLQHHHMPSLTSFLSSSQTIRIWVSAMDIIKHIINDTVEFYKWSLNIAGNCSWPCDQRSDEINRERRVSSSGVLLDLPMMRQILLLVNKSKPI